MPSHMSDSAPLQPPQSQHSISCTICRQRKVKCDKQRRCRNCIKAGVECTYPIPTRPRRRVGNGKASQDASKEELLHRLRQYEDFFKKNGLTFDGGDYENGIGESPIGEPSYNAISTVTPGEVVVESPQKSNIFADLSSEILEDFFERDSPASSIPENPKEDPDSLTLSFALDSGPESLTSLHPPSTQIFKLWEKFLDNVNPIFKVIHVPTVQREFLQATLNLEKVSKPFEALMFAIYICAVTSLSNEECEALTSVSREQFLKRYFTIAQKALTRAGIFGTTDIVVLQAAVLLLVAILPRYDPGEFWVLTGIVLRIGQRIGLHQVSYSANLSVLEAQIRRRIWWQIFVLDSRCAHRCKVDGPISSKYWDIPLPLNVNDSDLTPDMIIEPRGHLGYTEMTFRLMMCDLGKYRRYSTAMELGGSSDTLSSPSVPLPRKDKVIDDIEQMLESKYLRYCDPVIPLHILARSFANIVIGRMRLITRHPRQFLDRGSSMVQEEKAKLFDICLTMIEEDNFLHSVDCVRGFMWLVDLEFHVDAFVYLLSELRYRNPEPLTERAWDEISKAFRYRPDILYDTKSALNMAIGNLALKSWESWEMRSRQFGGKYTNSEQSITPEFVLELLKRRPIKGSSSFTEASGDYSAATMELDTNPTNYLESVAGASLEFGPSTIVDPLAPIDWNYWNDLINDAETYTIGNPVPGTTWLG
ncbi:hypothetical protein G7Y89_g519 [Cudoniella acicularis]|uniref:Zn(2)-C6 fungal-type domain-containing protein n=1 Tax=Cudoniella acicularis TaxID=354080 RepID=A0A8H4RY03_9HELO|nr:hypothetical protein G7Y89_g519 [Cudoniella acicularis]